MTRNLYAIKDSKSEFLSLMEDVNDASALRNFSYAVNNSESLMHFSPSDFSLWRFGIFDHGTGTFHLSPVPELVVSGDSILTKE